MFKKLGFLVLFLGLFIMVPHIVNAQRVIIPSFPLKTLNQSQPPTPIRSVSTTHSRNDSNLGAYYSYRVNRFFTGLRFDL